MKKFIRMFKTDVLQGRRRCFHGCPAARAISRVFPGKQVAVHGSHIYLRAGETWWEIKAPKRLVKFVAEFDDGGPTPEPINFYLEIPECCSTQ
jgi:hypothetical protein